MLRSQYTVYRSMENNRDDDTKRRRYPMSGYLYECSKASVSFQMILSMVDGKWFMTCRVKPAGLMQFKTDLWWRWMMPWLRCVFHCGSMEWMRKVYIFFSYLPACWWLHVIHARCPKKVDNERSSSFDKPWHILHLSFCINIINQLNDRLIWLM